jgi:hypothetical protein
MEQLVRGVESGTGSLGKMGVHFKATGDFAKDLNSAVEALGDKFGGAGEEDGKSLSGRLRRVSNSAESLMETFGSMFDELDRRTGAIDTLSKALDDLNSSLQTKGALRTFLGDSITSEQEMDELLAGSAAAGRGSRVGKGAGRAGQNYGPEYRPGDLLSTKGSGATKSKGKPKSAVDLINAAGADDERLARQVEANKRWIKEQEEFDLKQEELYQKQMGRLNESISKSNDLMIDAFTEQEEQHVKDLEKLGEIQFEFMKRQTDQQALELQRRQTMWMRIGAQIGQALINGILDMIEGSKGGQDNSKTAISITRSLFNVLFSAFGMGWLSQSAFGAMDAAQNGGGGLGALAAFSGAGASLGYSAPTPTQHTGGWIEKFHNGGPVLARDERMAVLQTGETVWSRADVARNGGRGAVDAMRAGGGGGRPTVIQAFDSTSLLDFFGDRGGRGMLNAARANVGPLRLMFGKVG